MGGTMRYLTYPLVKIDPALPVGLWSLSKTGENRTRALAASGCLVGSTQILSSAEIKAVETAAIVSAALGVGYAMREDIDENDCPAMGYLPPIEFYGIASLLPAHPGRRRPVSIDLATSVVRHHWIPMEALIPERQL